MSEEHCGDRPPKHPRKDPVTGGGAAAGGSDDEEGTAVRRAGGAERRRGAGISPPPVAPDQPQRVSLDPEQDFSDRPVADEGDGFFPRQFYANPFYRKDLSDYFPDRWRPGSDYEISLKATKELFETAQEIPGMLSGRSPVHPFLEVGGGLRVQVPLPETMAELKELCDVVLRKSHDNWRLTEAGFTKGSHLPELSKCFDIGDGKRLKNLREHPDVSFRYWQNTKRGLLLWDDPAGKAGINSQKCPDLICLIGSIIYQRSDMISYGGARGRYPAHVVRRLLDGHAYENENRARSIFAFVVDQEDGYPYGYYHGVVTKSEVNLTDFSRDGKETKVTVPSILLNYTFSVDYCDRETVKTTMAMRAALTAYVSKYVTGLPTHYHYMAVHTDKCAAAISTGGQLSQEVSQIGRSIHKAIADTCFEMINRRGDVEPVKEEFLCDPEYNGIVLVDPSTVPPFDVGEEVASRGNPFYDTIYPTYYDLVRRKTGLDINEVLGIGTRGEGPQDGAPQGAGPQGEARRKVLKIVNGKIDFEKVPERSEGTSPLMSLRQICQKYGVGKDNMLNWFSQDDCLSYKRPKKGKETSSLIKRTGESEFDFTVASLFEINGLDCHKCFNDEQSLLERSDDRPGDKLGDILGDRKAEFLQDVARTVQYWAKLGNSSNLYWTRRGASYRLSPEVVVPRLTDYGFFLIGELSMRSDLDILANDYLRQLRVDVLPKAEAPAVVFRQHGRDQSFAQIGGSFDNIMMTAEIIRVAELDRRKRD